MKNELLLCTVVLACLVLSACETSLGKETPVDTSQPEVTSTMPATMTPTIEATIEVTEAPEPRLIEWENIEFEISGRPMEFVIGKEEGANTENKWGITSLEINENLESYQEKFAELISFSLWQVYLSEGGQTTFEEFLKTPELYKIGIVTPNDKGDYQYSTFTMDQIKRFELRYLGYGDSRLYMNDPTIVSSDYFYGYEMKSNGTFVIYQSWPNTEGSLDGILGPDYPENSAKEYGAGEMVGQLLLSVIYGIGSTRELDSPEGLSGHKGGWLIFHKALQENTDLPSIEKMRQVTGGTSTSNAAEYFTKHGFWVVTLVGN